MKARPFAAFDGESIGPRYVLLARADDYIYARRGLDTATCLAFLAARLPRNPIRVFFGMSFDVAHILRDLDEDFIAVLWKGDSIQWGNYWLRYIPGKIFTVRLGRQSATYYDTSGFFGASFVTACKAFEVPLPKIIQQGKRARAHFQTWTKARLVDYNRAECVALAALCEKLRTSLRIKPIGYPFLEPRSWHGPGAVASIALRESGASRHIYPERVYTEDFRQVLAHAYFGGRIENTVAGTIAGPVWRYDLHAAYAWALAQLPSLAFRWLPTKHMLADTPFAIYRLRWDMRRNIAYHNWPGPLPWRDKEGYIIFRGEGEGWYWGPEAQRAVAYYPGVEVLDGWYMEDRGDRPLAGLIGELHEMRLGADSLGSPVAGLIKRIVNAVYGKTIQATKHNRYYSLAWAGYTTALIRARMLDAIKVAPHAILACLTDGIISSEKLPLGLGPGMGQWEGHSYSKALILAPGVYRLGPNKGPDTIARWRGFTVARFPWAKVLAEIRQGGTASIDMPLFVSPIMAALAPEAYKKHALTFITEPRTITPLYSHKRFFYRGLASRNPDGINLASQAVRSRLVMAEPGIPPALSWPYVPNNDMSVDREERASLELTNGLWGN